MLKFVAMQHFCDEMNGFYMFYYSSENAELFAWLALDAGFWAYSKLVLEALCEVAWSGETDGICYFGY